MQQRRQALKRMDRLWYIIIVSRSRLIRAMEKNIFLCYDKQKMKWMTVCIITLIITAINEQFLYGFLVNNHDGVLAVALFKLVTTSFFHIMIVLTDLTCTCYMYNMLRQAAKNDSATINKLCCILISIQVLNVVNHFSFQILYPNVPDSIDHFYPSYTQTIIRGLFSLACFVSIIWLCVCLIRIYTGRIKTLGVLWLATLLLPQLLALTLILTENMPDSIIADSWITNLLSIQPYINLICAIIPLILIYRCFRITQKSE